MQKLFSTRPQPIQLSSDDEDDFNASSVGVGSCIPCLPRFLLGTGPIQLSIEQDATLDDYLDPRTTTSIEPLLDEYNSHGNDAMDGGNDAFGGAILHERSLTRNPFASSSAFGNISSVRDPAPPVQVDFLLETDAEDAEFLSDHRISAVIGDTSKVNKKDEGTLLDSTLFSSQLSRQFELFQAEQQQEDGYKDDSGDRVEPFELDKSDWTATRESSISNEVQQSVIDVPCSLGGEDAAAIPDTCNEGGEYEDTSPITTEDSPINSGSLDNPTSLTDPADDMDKVASITIEQNPPPNDYTYETPTSKEDLVDTSPAAALFSPSPPPSPIPTVSNTLSIRSSSLPHDTPERPTLPLLTTVSTAPSDLPSSQDIPPNDGYIMNGTSIMTSTTSSSPEMVPGAEIDHTGKRRPSVASVAHSFLGDKLDDFTEKLAYIRKNIIMSLDDNNNDDDDDDGDHEDLFNLRQQQHQPPLRRSRSGSLQDWRQ